MRHHQFSIERLFSIDNKNCERDQIDKRKLRGAKLRKGEYVRDQKTILVEMKLINNP